jgi:peptidoglycan hydrolase-like protein with peptidoglycan-binding domain
MPSMLPATESFTPCGAFSCLKQGASGPEVEYLQRQLQEAGFDVGAVDGFFSARTKAALMAFQRGKGLEVNGIAGPKTWSALDVQRGSGQRPVLKRGVSDMAVQVIQKMLAAHGFEPGAKDGIFGAKTERAVMAFQRAKGLEADGIVGPKTWGALSSQAISRPFSASTSVGVGVVLPISLPEGGATYSI